MFDFDFDKLPLEQDALPAQSGTSWAQSTGADEEERSSRRGCLTASNVRAETDEEEDDGDERGLLGHWRCKGSATGGAPKGFRIRRGNGQLWLESETSTEATENRRICGGLAPQGDHLLVLMTQVNGAQAGALRLRRLPGRLAAAFRPANTARWESDVEMWRVDPAARGGNDPPASTGDPDGRALIGWEEEDPSVFDVSRGWKPCLWELSSVAAWRRARRETTCRKRSSHPTVLPCLVEAAVNQFRSRGLVGPMLALGEGELDCCRQGVARFVERCNGFVSSPQSLNNHVTLPWLYRLARHPRIVGAVACALRTEEVLLFNSCMFLREPGTFQEHGVGWHQDGVMYERVLDPIEECVTAFVALTLCERENGCLQFVPPNFNTGFQNGGQIPIQHMELMPGEFSLHSAQVTHRGGANQRPYRRDCLALRYISGRVRDRVAEAKPGAKLDWVVSCSSHSGWAARACGARPVRFAHIPEPLEELGQKERALRSEIASLRSVRYGTTQFEKPA